MSANIKVIKTIDKDDLAKQKEIRPFVKMSERMVRVSYDSIVIRKGFNLRDMASISDGLEELADSIEHMGLQKPLAVDILTTGEAALTDGERRYRAIGIIRGRSKDMKEKFSHVDVIINDKTFNEAQRITAMLVHNAGKPFEPQEEAEGFRRLRDDYMMDLKAIAAAVGKSIPYVEQRLMLADADDEEKENIRTKKISPTAQVQLMRKEKDPAKRKATVSAATAKGKKVKVKDVREVPVGKKCDEILSLIADLNKEVKGGRAQNLLFEIDAKVRELKRDAK